MEPAPLMKTSDGHKRPSRRRENEEEEEDATALVADRTNAKLGMRRQAAAANGTRKSQARAAFPASDLLSCLSEFLAARNVINRTERYEKIADDDADDRRRARVRETDLRHAASCFEYPRFHAKWPPASSQPPLPDGYPATRLPALAFRQAERVKRFEQCDRWDRRGGKQGIGRLLSDALSGRRGNRLAALLRLLRAPVVLAAMFSFGLAISLITLYTLSFHHCQARASLALVRAMPGGGQPFLESKAGGSAPRINRNNNSETPKEALVTVETECGSYEGQPEGGALKFRGVAYASPPVGSRRWQKPRPIWLDGTHCSRGGVSSRWAEQVSREHCVQLSPFDHRVSGSEDCLYLDIYTPALKLNQSDGGESAQPKRLPVMVYIHGGFLVFGSNGAEQASGRRPVNWMGARPSGQLASELNVVLVAPNYRLQALGFMALSQLALDNGPDGSEGNYGLWDQLIALQWIRRNIDSFGGDPSRVLLFGPDAASALPLALVSRKQPRQKRDDGEEPIDRAAGQTVKTIEACRKNNSDDDYEQLFHSVWLMNPTIYYELPYELANQHYARLIKSQSVCSSDLEPAQTTSASYERSQQPPVHAENHTSRHASRLAEWREASEGLLSKTAANKTARRLIDCLLGLSGEQIVREYLGRDDAAFRLDDENSLPIRNIFPDQFVTLDGQLVRDSFPFLRWDAGRGHHRAALRRPLNFLIGSTAQAVEFWPCPRNLADWSWTDFRHYVSTSLNSFNQADETFKLASELYQVPTNCSSSSSTQTSRVCSNTTASPAEAYLTMVSDIRQVCPARELSKSLRLAAGSVDSLEHYLVEWRPSARLAAGLAAARGGLHEATHAFHYWDLLALFGFEFESPRLEPEQADFEFQRQIRSMARRWAWSERQNSSRPDNNGERVERVTIFTLDKQVRSDDDTYKGRECKMWQQSLKQSYAWIS